MQLLNPKNPRNRSPLEGRSAPLGRRLVLALDAARRAVTENLRGLREAVRRQVRANSLVHLRDGRLSVGIDVGDIGLGRIEPADVGA